MRYLSAAAPWRHLFGLVVLAAAVAILAWRADLPAVGRLLGEVRPLWLLPAVSLFGLSKFIHSQRWRLLLSPAGDGRGGELYGLFSLANAVNALIPLRAGDVVRVQIAAGRLGESRAKVTAGVFVVETLLDGLAFALLLTIAVAFQAAPGPGGVVVGVFAVFVILAIGAAVLLGRHADYIGGRLAAWSPPARWLAPRLASFVEGLSAFSNPGRLALLTTLSVAGWSLEATAYACFGEAFGLNLEPLAYIGLMIAANLVTAVPLTPFGIGVYELGVQAVAVALGAAEDEALAFAVGAHAALQAYVLVAGLVALLALRLKPGEVLYLRPRKRSKPGY
ncbi:MAG: lysylphosphatidylglycerol synthase transmembrane domain-containing protein [Dehalococcoidia bacterium]